MSAERAPVMGVIVAVMILTLAQAAAAENSEPYMPTLLTPSDGSVITTLTPTFTWSSFSDPDAGDTQDAFNIRVWEAAGPNSLGTVKVLDKEYSGKDSSITPSATDYISGLVYGRWYHWCVRVKDNDSAWSYWAADTLPTYMDFKLDAKPNMPTLLTPSDGSVITTLTPTFTWSSFSDPDAGDTQDAFNIRVWEAAGPNSLGTVKVLDKEYSGKDSSITPSATDYISGLVYGRWYHWCVRVKDNDSAWSYWAADTLPTYMDFKTLTPSTPTQILSVTSPQEPKVTPPQEPTVTPPQEPTVTPPQEPSVTPPQEPSVTPPREDGMELLQIMGAILILAGLLLPP